MATGELHNVIVFQKYHIGNRNDTIMFNTTNDTLRNIVWKGSKYNYALIKKYL